MPFELILLGLGLVAVIAFWLTNRKAPSPADAAAAFSHLAEKTLLEAEKTPDDAGKWREAAVGFEMAAGRGHLPAQSYAKAAAAYAKACDAEPDNPDHPAMHSLMLLRQAVEEPARADELLAASDAARARIAEPDRISYPTQFNYAQMLLELAVAREPAECHAELLERACATYAGFRSLAR